LAERSPKTTSAGYVVGDTARTHVNSGNILGPREASCKRIFFIGRIENCEAWRTSLRHTVQSVISQPKEAKAREHVVFFHWLCQRLRRRNLSASSCYYLTKKTWYP